MPNKIYKERIFNYLDNKCSLEEAQFIQQWLADPANENEAELILNEYWINFRSDSETATTEFAQVYESILNKAGILETKQAPVRKINLFRFAGAIAAASVILFFSWPLFTSKNIVFKTGYGETREIKLPDGSVVKLNSNSSLSYPGNWDNAADREVFLSGEAFFSVKHLPGDQKFRVATEAKFKVEVLGTEFSVYKRNGDAQVVLNSGKVKIDFDDRNKEDVVMKPGELVQVDKAGLAISKKAVDPVVYNSWKDGKIVFKETSMNDLGRLLKDNYGLNLVLKDKHLEKMKINGTLPGGSQEILLSALEAIMQVNIRIKSDTLVITAK